MITSWRRTLIAVSAALCSTIALACRRTPPPRITVASLERCERGIERAVGLASAQEMTAVYYRECSQIQAEAPCQLAFLAAAKAEPDRQLVIAFQGCAPAYCPLFSDKDLEACQPQFQATNDTLWRAWPALHKAILTRDTGTYAPRIEHALLQFLIALKAKPSAAPVAATDKAPLADAASAGLADAASAAPADAASADKPPAARKKH